MSQLLTVTKATSKQTQPSASSIYFKLWLLLFQQVWCKWLVTI